MIRTDKGPWTVVSMPDSVNGYRVASGSTVIAENVTFEVATQIVDEHFVVRKIVNVLAERERTPLEVNRAPL